jgi:pimeloyl-ACP methyl ester carboxylesterase
VTLVEARGLRFNVRRLGTGAPVVMIHGLLTGSIASWYLTCAPRLARRWAPLLVDLRGHGRSDRPRSGYGAASLAADLAALTEDLPPFPIVAHSYGCIVAARFAAAHPGRVRGLALVEPPFGLDLDPRLDVSTLTAQGRGLSARRAADLQGLVAGTSILADVTAEPELTDDEIAALPADLLVVFGDRSPCRLGVAAVHRSRPDAEVVLLPGDHEVHTQSVGALSELLDGFLDRCAASAAPRAALP